MRSMTVEGKQRKAEVQYMKEHGFVHGYVCGRNILFARSGRQIHFSEGRYLGGGLICDMQCTT